MYHPPLKIKFYSRISPEIIAIGARAPCSINATLRTFRIHQTKRGREGLHPVQINFENKLIDDLNHSPVWVKLYSDLKLDILLLCFRFLKNGPIVISAQNTAKYSKAKHIWHPTYLERIKELRIEHYAKLFAFLLELLEKTEGLRKPFTLTPDDCLYYITIRAFDD